MESPFEIMERNGSLTPLAANRPRSSRREGLNGYYDRGPTPMADDLRQVTLVWAAKMLDRFRGQSNPEAQYRRMQLLMQSIEDYFALRGTWFRGPKEGFAWLLEYDAATHHHFESALQPGAPDAAFAALVEAVYGPFIATSEQADNHTGGKAG